MQTRTYELQSIRFCSVMYYLVSRIFGGHHNHLQTYISQEFDPHPPIIALLQSQQPPTLYLYKP